MCVCVRACMRACMRAGVHVCEYVCMHMCIHALGCAAHCAHVCVCACAQSYMHVYVSMLACVVFHFFIFYTISTVLFLKDVFICCIIPYSLIFIKNKTFQILDVPKDYFL